MAGSFLCMLLFVFLGAAIVLLMIFGIYSKIRRERILEHETRKRIVDHIRENPGAHYSAILEALGLPHGVLTHHINMLEAQEVVFSKQDRQYRRFYIDGMYRTGPLILGTQKSILDEVRRHPGRSQAQVARKLGLGRMVVSYHVSELQKLGMVSIDRNGRENHLFPTPPGDPGALLNPIGPGTGAIASEGG